MTQPIDRETAIALAKEAGAYYAGSTNPGTVYMLSENDIERLCNLAASRTKMPELEPPIYGRELVLQLATDAGCPNGCLASFALHHPEWDWIERLCNLAVAHSRKDAEPVAKIISSGPADFPLLQWLSADLSFREPIGSLLYAHPPEADTLLQQALEALEYRLQQTRPIHQADVVMESIRTYLENKT